MAQRHRRREPPIVNAHPLAPLFFLFLQHQNATISFTGTSFLLHPQTANLFPASSCSCRTLILCWRVVLASSRRALLLSTRGWWPCFSSCGAFDGRSQTSAPSSFSLPTGSSILGLSVSQYHGSSFWYQQNCTAVVRGIRTMIRTVLVRGVCGCFDCGHWD